MKILFPEYSLSENGSLYHRLTLIASKKEQQQQKPTNKKIQINKK